MLSELRIKNFVLIDELALSFGKGLNILTGETGAGKSILIDAISGVLGEKMTTDMIRAGSDRAILEGVFDISNLPQVKTILDDSGIDSDDGSLIMRRELYASGKGRCFANATQIPVAKMKEVADYLLDIHGQNEHQNIVRVNAHRELLDSFAGNADLVAQVAALHKELQLIKESIESFEMDEKEKARKTEYLSYAINEIENAKLRKNEEEELTEEENILSNAEKIFSHVNLTSDLLKGDGGIIPSLKKAEQSLASIAEIDPQLGSTLENLRQAFYTLEDCSAVLRGYEKSINYSPARVNEVEERLSLISSLRKKYGSTTTEILQFAERSKEELEAISSSDEKIEKLKSEYSAKLKSVKECALALSDKRTKVAKLLEESVMRELTELNMAGTKFRVSIKRELNPAGEIECDNKRYVLYPHGLDRVEFLLAANEGEELHELRKVASGGEMSRIMLAIKKVILSNDIVDSLIFDEVDTGISGKTAEIVGKKLKSLAGTRQVLVITHLPQIAAMSDTHFMVQKEKTADRTHTRVKKLTRNEKVLEVARMLAGEQVTDLSKKHAEEMVSMADRS
ncbi:MAG TPA: DNA repair protein RecN [Spirochaetota bacterium]